MMEIGPTAFATAVWIATRTKPQMKLVFILRPSKINMILIDIYFLIEHLFGYAVIFGPLIQLNLYLNLIKNPHN